LGTRQTLLETKDAGATWQPRPVPAAADEGFNYRFVAASFADDGEGWIVGKPAILLKTKDAGETWDRVPLSAKLPGAPVGVTALGGGKAEMVTDVGAVYATSDGADTWRAAVEETVDATLNRTVSSGISGASYYEGSFSGVRRDPATGAYLGVSSRGNFYMTWAPGQTYWTPHNRPSTRRVQAMGFRPDGRLWLTTRSGDVLAAKEAGLDTPDERGWESARISSRGFGILDVAFTPSDPRTGYAVGGSGSLFKTTDAGATWRRDRSADGLPANLYACSFARGGAGFVLGNDGVLLRYVGGR